LVEKLRREAEQHPNGFFGQILEHMADHLDLDIKTRSSSDETAPIKLTNSYDQCDSCDPLTVQSGTYRICHSDTGTSSCEKC